MKIPEQLEQAASVAREKNSYRTTPREIVGWYGGARRGPKINLVVREHLKKCEVTTVPDFESEYIDSPIYIVPRPNGDENTEATVSDAGEAEPMERQPASVTPAHRISRLKTAKTKVVWVSPEDMVVKAKTLMLAFNYSQLPVMQSEYSPKGMISWRSIGEMAALDKPCVSVADCMQPHHEVKITASIFSVIQFIVQYDCVLVRDDENRISGIVTAADIVEQFQAISEPFLVLEDIETRLRRLIDMRFNVKQLQEARDPNDDQREVNSVADLTFGEYKRLLEDPKMWCVLKLPLDRQVFVEHLDKVREIRNDVMHFEPDGIDGEQLNRLRNFDGMLETALSVAE